MKKILVLGIALFFLLLITTYEEKSYAYVDCSYNRLYLQEVNSLNLPQYLDGVKYKELIEICSYDNCYEVKEGNISNTLNDFYKMYYKSLSEEDRLVVSVKGFPITEIVVDNC